MNPTVSNEITLEQLVEHWEQDTTAHAQMTKAWERKFDDQNKTLVVVVTKLTDIEEHLKKLNGSVAKHEQSLNSQDVMNAKTALIQQQTTEKLKEILDDKKDSRTFWRGALVPVLISIGLSTVLLILVRTGILNLQQDTVAGHDDIQQAVTDALLEFEATQ